MAHLDESQGSALATVFPLVCALLLLCGSGLWSGLSVGLLGIDRNLLQLKVASGGNKYEKARAALLLRITADRHRLLVTILLMNTLCLECLPLVLELAVSGAATIVISVAGVLIFGEVIPMSVLTGPRQFQLTASLAPLVQFFMCVLYPANWPCGKLLDFVVGKERQGVLHREHLKALIQLNCEQGEQDPCSPKKRGGSAKRGKSGGAALDQIDRDETRFVVSALDFCSQTAANCLRGLNEVFMVEENEYLNDSLLMQVRQAGYSRVPIFSKDRSNILGVLLTKELVGVDARPEQTLRHWAQSQSDQANVGGAAAQPRLSSWRQPLTVSQELPLLELLGQLRMTDECRMAIVVEPAQAGTWKGQQVLGIATLADVFEELLQGQIWDEFQAFQTKSLVNVIGNAQDPSCKFEVEDEDTEEHKHSSLREHAG